MTNTMNDPTAYLAIRPDSGEPTTEQPTQRALPQFATAVRGYDRSQVDDYLNHLFEWLEEAEIRTRRAEETAGAAARDAESLRRRLQVAEEHAGLPSPTSLAIFGTRVGELFEQAVEAAQHLHLQAEEEARALRDGALEERDRLLQRAQDEAGEVIEAARRQEEGIRERIGNLGSERALAMGELAAIRARLAELLETPEAPPGVRGVVPYDVEAPQALPSADAQLVDGDPDPPSD